jgi:transglutaminase-like putative cysteine protease
VLFEVLAEQEGNLRGAVYDEYTGSGWRVSAAAIRELSGTTVDAAGLGTMTSRAMLREPLRAEVTVVGETAPTSALLSPGEPVTTDTAARLLVDEAGHPLALVPDEGAEIGESYTTVGTVSVAAIPTLQEAGINYPAEVFQRYTALPDDLPAEVASLAHTVTATAGNPYDAARAVEEYLRQNYAFTYNVPAAPARRDAVAHFLFDERRGYFDQFASAMVVMLRSQGIPARVAAGFALDDRDLDATTRLYRVSEERAWSWPEVYFPGLGWVEFNPTPSRGIIERPGDDSAARAAADFQNNGISTEFEIDAFLEAEAASAPGISLEELEAMMAQQDGGVRALVARLVGWLFVAATLVVIAAVGGRVWWERRFHGLSAPEKRWAKLVQLAALAGLQPSHDRTAVEAADDLGSRIGHGPGLHEIARAFSAQRYGGSLARAESEERAAQLDEAYGIVRAELRRQIVRRVLRLGRVAGGPLARWNPAAGAAR